MKKLINTVLGKYGYRITNVSRKGKRFKNKSTEKGLSFFQTPIANYYLPDDSLDNDTIADIMSRGKIFEAWLVEVVKKYIKEGSTVLDIGANFGQMTILFSSFVGENGNVYSFEAQPKVYNILEKNIQANNCSNVTLIKGAVYNENGLRLFFSEPEKSYDFYGGNSINPKLDKGEEVKTITVDSLNIQTPVSFIKVDVQGSDLFSLQGARKTIKKNKPVILFEFEENLQEQFNTSFQDYVDFVNEIGYRFVSTILKVNYLIVPK